jgi:hypothetical protein
VRTQRAVRDRAQPARFSQAGIRLEAQAEETAHGEPLHAHLAVLRDLHHRALG